MDFSTVGQLIVEAEADGRIGQLRGVSGLSGGALVGMLQRLALHQRERGCYLEIGVFQGNTLLSVAHASPGIRAFGIDNFSQFDAEGTNKSIIETRIADNAIQNATLLDLDYEDALERYTELMPGTKAGLYFVDGPHDYRSQLMCLLLARPHLARNAIIVVDDCNYRHVRLANRDFLVAHPEFKLLFQAYTPTHPGNATAEQLESARAGWWNGVNVIVHDPDDVLLPMHPPTLRDRALYENEHLVHAAKRGFLAPEAVAFFSELLDFHPVRAARNFVRTLRKSRSTSASHVGAFASMNTFSDDLDAPRFNAGLAP